MLPLTRKRLVFTLVFFLCAVAALAKFGPASNAEIGPIAESNNAAVGTTPTATATATGTDYGSPSPQPTSTANRTPTFTPSATPQPTCPGGMLDPSFDGDGRVTASLSPQGDGASAVAIQPDGKILVGGSTWINQHYHIALVRYNTDGSLDTSFNGSGYVITSLGGTLDTVTALAIRSDGKIVAAGYVNPPTGGGTRFVVLRYHSNGTLDTSFGVSGIATALIGFQSRGRALAIQSDGKLVVVGDSATSNYGDFAAARFTADGSLDPLFGTGGTLWTSVGIGKSIDTARSVAIQPDGKIVVAGDTSYTDERLIVVRYNTDGSLDTSFDGDGILSTYVGSHRAGGRSVIIQPDGRLVVGGWVSNSFNRDFALVRLNMNGTFDPSFDSDGQVTTTITNGDDTGSYLALLPDGKLVLAGQAYLANEDFAIARYNTDGSLDLSFNNIGFTTTAFGSDRDIASSLALQADGGLVVAGFTDIDYYDSAIAIARYRTNCAIATKTPTFTPTQTPTFTATNTPTAIPSPFPEYDLTISQAASPDPVFYNWWLTYTLTVTNSPAALGGGACPNVRFGWPTGVPFNFTSASGTNGYVGTVDSGGVTFAGGCVSSQGGVVRTATLTVVLTMRGLQPGVLTSLGSNVIVDPENNWPENNEVNNTAATIQTTYEIGGTPIDTRTPTFTTTPTPTNTATATATCTPRPFTNSALIAINDGAMSSSVIPVSNMVGTVTAVTVDLNGMSHSYPDDIDIMLVSPGGQNTLLMSDAGGDADINGSSFTFDDAVPLALPDDTRLLSGAFGPTNYDTTTDVFPAPAPAPGGPVAMGVFIGTNPNGVWRLYIRDDTNLDTGLISGGWTLHITTTGGSICATATATATATSFQPTPSLSFSSATYNEDESQVAAITIRKVIGVEPTFVSFSTTNGTATGGEACTSGVDFINISQQIFLPRFETEKTVYVTTCGDSIIEADETISLRLNNPIGATLGLSSAVLTINDTASAFRNTENISLTGGGSAMPYPSTITVTGGPTTIGSMRVTLYDLSSRFPDTADLLLIGPTGTKYILFAGAGGLTQSGPATLNLTDTAGQVLPDNGPLFGGDFEPTSWVSIGDLPPPAPSGPYNLPGSTVGGTGTQTLEGNFGGTNANGVWRLYLRDRSSATDRVGNLAGGWGIEFIGPTATHASISGRVMTGDGHGIRSARVVVTGNSLVSPVIATTGSFGYFTFEGLATGETYVVTVNSKRYMFSTPSRVINLVGNVNDADFIADPLE